MFHLGRSPVHARARVGPVNNELKRDGQGRNKNAIQKDSGTISSYSIRLYVWTTNGKKVGSRLFQPEELRGNSNSRWCYTNSREKNECSYCRKRKNISGRRNTAFKVWQGRFNQRLRSDSRRKYRQYRRICH